MGARFARGDRETFEGGFSFRSTGLLMSDHGPTHVDAIAHLDPDAPAPTTDTMPLETLYGDATCLDLSHKEPRTYISADDTDAAEGAAEAQVAPGQILLVRTGAHERLHGTPANLSQYPGLDESGSAWLRDRGVKAFGVDSPSPDNPASRTHPCHMMCRAEASPTSRTSRTSTSSSAGGSRSSASRCASAPAPARRSERSAS
jgi:kynurenine formamidase